MKNQHCLGLARQKGANVDCIHVHLRLEDEFIFVVQWNLVIKRSDITKPSYNKVILLVPPLYISLFLLS